MAGSRGKFCRKVGEGTAERAGDGATGRGCGESSRVRFWSTGDGDGGRCGELGPGPTQAAAALCLKCGSQNRALPLRRGAMSLCPHPGLQSQGTPTVGGGQGSEGLGARAASVHPPLPMDPMEGGLATSKPWRDWWGGQAVVSEGSWASTHGRLRWAWLAALPRGMDRGRWWCLGRLPQRCPAI